MMPYSPNLGSMLLHTTNDDQLSTLTTKVKNGYEIIIREGVR